MNVITRATVTTVMALLAAGCDDAPPPNTGGTAEGRGLVVVNTDYQATNTSLVAFDGRVLSSSFFSSSSPTLHPELNAPALSMDVVQPTMPQRGDRIVFVDRYFGVLSWVDVKSGKLTAQLPIGEKIALNLQDYVEISPNKAYVPNLDPHLDPSLGSVEKGSNVVIIDPSAPSITGVIDLAPAMAGEDPKFYPRPNRAVLVGKKAIVLLSAYSKFFDASAVSRLVTLDTDTDTIVSTTKIADMHGCTGLALSPSGTKLAVSCSGVFHVEPPFKNPAADTGNSGLIVYSIEESGLVEDGRFGASALGEGPLGFTVSFVDERHVAFTTFGSFTEDGHPARPDAFLVLDTASGKADVVLHADDPFSIGEVRCIPDASLCFVTQVKGPGRSLLRFPVSDGVLGKSTEITVDPAIGLPPRYLGQF